MTLAAIFIPDWITWTVDTDDGGHYTKVIGLHRSCSSTTGRCIHYPQQEDCLGSDRYFCSMWRSVGFMMSFTAVLELATLVAYVVVILGGKQKREGGWRVLAGMLLLIGLVQCASMAIVVCYTIEREDLLTDLEQAYLFDNDERFFIGWKLDKSWILCTVSWSIAVLSAAFISLSAFVFPPEDGYELIPSERYGR
jgi:hypothetical protein